MIYSTKITFVPKENEEKSLSFENVKIGLVSTINMREQLLEKFRSLKFREISENGYFDYVTVLTFEEFQNFYNSKFDLNIFSKNDYRKFEFTQSGKVRYNWVIIQVSESTI